MILYDFAETENHPIYQALAISNGDRQFGFLQAIVNAAIESGQQFMSHSILKALNFHAIACLHTSAGLYRPCEVHVGETYFPPPHYRVPDMMEQFVNLVNRNWAESDPVVLGAFILWRLNAIHPFINGNGRTARAACYFAICIKLGAWLPGDVILPTLLKRENDEYIAALKACDASVQAGTLNLQPLHLLIARLLAEQLGIDPTDFAVVGGTNAPSA